MGLFSKLFKKKVELTEEELKWNKMWDLWADDKLEEPISSLLTYDGAIQGEGHYCFFDNLDEEKEIKKVMKNLKKILSDEMYANLEAAYENYKKLEESDEDCCDEDGLPPYDVFYYEHEEEVQNILKEYASKIEL